MSGGHGCEWACSLQMLEAFARCKEIGALAQVHAENGDLIAVVSFSTTVKKFFFISFFKFYL